VSYLLLFGTGGWTQRWQIPAGEDEPIRAAIHHVGQDGTGKLSVIDSQSDSPVTLVIAWQHVAAAVVVDTHDAPIVEGTTGQYA
jgi:hypothetical protein